MEDQEKTSVLNDAVNFGGNKPRLTIDSITLTSNVGVYLPESFPMGGGVPDRPSENGNIAFMTLKSDDGDPQPKYNENYSVIQTSSDEYLEIMPFAIEKVTNTNGTFHWKLHIYVGNISSTYETEGYKNGCSHRFLTHFHTGDDAEFCFRSDSYQTAFQSIYNVNLFKMGTKEYTFTAKLFGKEHVIKGGNPKELGDKVLELAKSKYTFTDVRTPCPCYKS